jgi:ubiquinone/menaquinone biosynthesis C-methylase UbiE
MKPKNTKYRNHVNDFGFKELYIGKVYAEWIFSIITPFLGKKILEIGSGIGAMFEHYPQSSYLIQSDINNSYLEVISERFKDQRQFRTMLLDITKLDANKLKRLQLEKIDTAVLINVLEHIKNDRLALKNIHNLLIKNGRIVLFVPALPFLYGSLDKAFDHYRRYTRKEIIEKAEIAGFTVEYIRYFNFVGIIWWTIAGKILRKKNLPRTTGLLLRIVVPVLAVIEKYIRIPIGQSIIMVGKKT